VKKLLFIILSIFILTISTGCSAPKQIVKKAEITDTSKIEFKEDIQVDEEDEEIPDTEIIEPSDEIESRILISEDNPSVDRHKLLSEIMPLMRVPYRKKGIGEKGFDCSGFTMKVFQDGLGYELPRSSKAQFSLGQPVDRDSLKFGDLVFFKTRRSIPSHVGIYVGDGLFAHASLKIGVTISLLDSKYYKKRYVGARRIIE
jgi:hypothetical protein